MRSRLFNRFAVGLVTVLVVAEAVVRLSGFADFPVYTVGDDIDYIPAKNQSGRFLRTNDWVYNDRSMGVSPNWSAVHPNLLLIGNSIVMGGNVLRQADKLGPLLQEQLGDRAMVWPIAAGRWSNVNEARYVEDNPDVVKTIDFFIWEYMAGGLSGISRWQGPLLFPDRRPMWATSFVMRRYLLPRLLGYSLIEQQPAGPATAENISAFETALAHLCAGSNGHARGILLLYPSEPDLSIARQGGEWLPERHTLQHAAAGCVSVVDLAQEPRWQASLYADGTHPTKEGNRVIAEILANEIAIRSAAQ